MKTSTLKVGKNKYTTYSLHTLVIGSGAAGLNAAIQLDASGIKDILIVTEGLQKGTSINTGSDKQTYYKLGMYGANNDSPDLLAQSFFNGGSMHGDLALVEASLSARAFFNLVNLGVPFPRDRYGQFAGYKTDHDTFRRATSVGPYTSREMCRALIAEVKKRKIPVHEERVVVSLLTIEENGEKRAVGAVAIRTDLKSGVLDKHLEVYIAENIVFAVGGPGGLYKTSVYPEVHTGAIGLALMEGAKAQSLQESQFGLASIKFRWNVSGTYMQVIPKFISTGPDGAGEAVEFMRPYFNSVGEMNTAIFLKGYQWPFDPRKVQGGSSIVDILVYIETVIKGRRVFLDFRSNCEGFSFDSLGSEAREYLEKSNALFGTPIERL
ncbi:MAG: FAD-binding protein, partial [Candidatus Nanoarchaeia archaeon]